VKGWILMIKNASRQIASFIDLESNLNDFRHAAFQKLMISPFKVSYGISI
jgi:hypothetical protein